MGPTNLRLGGRGRSHSTAKSAAQMVSAQRSLSTRAFGSTPCLFLLAAQTKVNLARTRYQAVGTSSFLSPSTAHAVIWGNYAAALIGRLATTSVCTAQLDVPTNSATRKGPVVSIDRPNPAEVLCFNDIRVMNVRWRGVLGERGDSQGG